MRRLHTSLVPGVTLGASLVAHAAFVLASYGPGPRSVASLRPIPVEIPVVVERERMVAPEAPPLQNRANRAAVTRSAEASPASQPRAARREAASVAKAPDEPTSLPHFVIAIAAGGSGARDAAAAPMTPGDGERAPESDTVLSADAVDVPASLSRGQVADYPQSARENGVEADVGLELIVSREGAVESARVLRHVGYGLDDAALTAARGFWFTPATKRGRPVRVRVRWTVEFRLE
jgi:protein TonB